MSRFWLLLIAIIASGSVFAQSIPGWLLPFWGGGTTTSTSPLGGGGLTSLPPISGTIDLNVNVPVTSAQIDEAIQAINDLNLTLGNSNQILQDYIPLLEELNLQLGTANGNWAQTNQLLQDYLNVFNQFVEPANLFRSGFALGAGLAAGTAAVNLVVSLLEQGVQALYQVVSGDLKRKQDRELFEQFIKIREFYLQTLERTEKTKILLKSLQAFYLKTSMLNFSNQDFLMLVRLQSRYTQLLIDQNKSKEAALILYNGQSENLMITIKSGLEMQDYFESLQNIELALKKMGDTPINCSTFERLHRSLNTLEKDLNQSRSLMISASSSVTAFLTEEYKAHQKRMAELSSGELAKRQKAELQRTMDEVIAKSKQSMKVNKDRFVDSCRKYLKRPFLTEIAICGDLFDRWFSYYRNEGQYKDARVLNDQTIIELIRDSVYEINNHHCMLTLFDRQCVDQDLLGKLVMMSRSDVLLNYIRGNYLIERDMVFSKISLYRAMELIDRGNSEVIRSQYLSKSLEFSESLRDLQSFVEQLKAELRENGFMGFSCF